MTAFVRDMLDAIAEAFGITLACRYTGQSRRHALYMERSKTVDPAPRFDSRPWGSFHVLDEGHTYKVKRIEVLPGKRLSYQKHAQRSEHWMVVQGMARVTLDGREIALSPGDAVDIPVGAAHRVENPGGEVLVFIEIQRGDYFGEDDIVRLQDDFGRVSARGPAPRGNSG